MALARWAGVVQDGQGNAKAGANVEVRREGDNALVPLFSDRNGTTGLGNPFTAASSTIGFHVAGGAYRIKATVGSFEQEWRYVGIGNAAEFDMEDIQAGLGQNLVTYTPQTLSPAEQEQARKNIGAIAIAQTDSIASAYFQQSGNLIPGYYLLDPLVLRPGILSRVNAKVTSLVSSGLVRLSLQVNGAEIWTSTLRADAPISVDDLEVVVSPNDEIGIELVDVVGPMTALFISTTREVAA